MDNNTVNVKTKKLNRLLSKKFLSFISLLFMAMLIFSLLASAFCGVSFFAQGAETPNEAVKTEIELINAIKAAPSDETSYVIGLSAYITLENSLEIPSGKNITLMSVGGFWRLYGADKQYTITVTGLLTIDGICITHKNGNSGGGVYVKTGGALTLLSGEISGNTGANDFYGTADYVLIAKGGGVCIDSGGSLDMSGGVISGNSAEVPGGGVSNAGTFTLSGGKISDNISHSGGGVYNSGVFVMSGGKIFNNTANSKGTGGGVYNSGRGVTFTMTGGEITGNNAHIGGGLAYEKGSFVMSGGVISDNNAYFADDDIHLWEIVSDPIRTPNGNNGDSDENNVPDSDSDFDVGSNSDSDVGVGSTEKLMGGLLLPVVVIVVVIAVGLVVAGLFFYRSKKPKQPLTKGLVGSDVV
jgi:hypothetical protein